MYYTVYRVTNIINQKIYVGVHKTKNINDGYYGSGIGITNAIKKYGKHSFSKEILFVYDNKEEAYAKEKEIVNIDFVRDRNTYNDTLGGYGGFSHIPPKFGDASPMRNKEIVAKAIKNMKLTRSKNKEYYDEISRKNLSKTRRPKTEEEKRKHSEILKAKHIKYDETRCKEMVENCKRFWENNREIMSEKLRLAYTEERKENNSKRFTGDGNPMFSGYYITPKGKFDSLTSAYKANNISQSALASRCRYKNDAILNINNIRCSPDLSIEFDLDKIGKTWKELGWGFEPISVDNDHTSVVESIANKVKIDLTEKTENLDDLF